MQSNFHIVRNQSVSKETNHSIKESKEIDPISNKQRIQLTENIKEEREKWVTDSKYKLTFEIRYVFLHSFVCGYEYLRIDTKISATSL